MQVLEEKQLQFYRENGYLILDGLYSDAEIDECSSEYDLVFERMRNSDLEATWKGDWNKDATNHKPTSV